ncbi:MAG: hypothetical protein JO261_07210 [Alphaproteobacteria bacterium]|nr:hypothetical protein [Alphaproteobacteria bacterium]MBV9693471.1 hypothetical protein [Alphaproteobacteria bacterium]
MASRSIIVHAESDAASAFPPAAVARTVAMHAAQSLEAGKFSVETRALSADDIGGLVRGMPWGHERRAPDANLILVDAAALLAYAPYRARVVLTGDPFAGADSLARELQAEPGCVRTRLHEGLISAERVIALSSEAFDAVAALTKRPPERRTLPPIALKPSTTENDPILVVDNEELGAAELFETLQAQVAEQSLKPFESADVLSTSWKAVVQLGIATSSKPGARLCDAWAGGVPVLQLLDRRIVEGRNRRQPGALADMVVQHGRNGLQMFSQEDLVSALRDLSVDPLPLRSVARGARRSIDAAALWDALLREVLQ